MSKVVSVMLVLVFLLSVVLMAVNLGHDCCKDHCLICEGIHSLNKVIKIWIIASFSLACLYLLTYSGQKVLAGNQIIILYTPLLLRVKLNN